MIQNSFPLFFLATSGSTVTQMSSPKVAIIYYSMYGHILKCKCVPSLAHVPLTLTLSVVAEAEKAGIEKAGGKADIYQYVTFPVSSFLIINALSWTECRKPFPTKF